LFWAARTVSWAGSGISGVVLPVLVYQRTGSPALTSLLAAVEALPYIAFGLLAGALADRVRRRRLMVGCDLGCAALMAAIPVAGAFGRLTIPLVVLVALAAPSLFVWFDAASFGAVPTLAGPGRVVQAVSGLSAAGSVTGLVAPAVAGGLLALIAPAQAIIVDAASYLISAVLLASIRRPFETRPGGGPDDGHGQPDGRQPAGDDQPDGDQPAGDDRPDGDQPRAGGGILDGLRFLWGHRLLRAMTMAGTAVSVTGGAGTGLLVVYAVSALGLARTDARIGLLYTTAAAGGLIAAVAVPRIRRRVPAGRVTLAFLGLNVVAVAGVALAPGFGFALIALAGYLFCYSMVTVNGIAYRQEITPDGLQSRVNTAGRMLAWGGYPLGALAGGALAEVLPIRVTLLVMTLPVAISFVLGFRPLSRDRQRG
jgi:MFS family permease